MGELVLKAARQLGIESHVHVLEDHQLEPLVTVRDGRSAIQCRMAIRWLHERDLTQVKLILGEMLETARGQSVESRSVLAE